MRIESKSKQVTYVFSVCQHMIQRSTHDQKHIWRSAFTVTCHMSYVEFSSHGVIFMF